MARIYAPAEIENPIAYSNNPEHYEPRCVPCHKRFDLGRVDSATTLG